MTAFANYDKQLYADCLNSLVIYLENCDGEQWNALRRELESIYKVTPAASYLPVASAACVDFATHWFWRAFPERDTFRTQWLINNRTKLIIGACVAIAHGELQEFQLGNFAA